MTQKDQHQVVHIKFEQFDLELKKKKEKERQREVKRAHTQDINAKERLCSHDLPENKRNHQADP